MPDSEEIQKLQARLDNLRKIYTEDIGASYKEAAQTEDMINMLELQMRELKNPGKKRGDSGRKFVLKDQKGNSIDVFVVEDAPDPSKNKFSASSPIGRELLLKHKGDNLILRGITYRIL